MTAPMIKTRYFSAVSAAPLGSRMRRDEDLFRSICRPPFHVVNEFFGHQPLDHRNQQDDQQEQDGRRRGVVDFALVVEHPVDVVHDGNGGVAAAGGVAGVGDEHGVDLVERAGHIDDGNQGYHPGSGAQQGEGHPEEGPERGGSINPGGLVDLPVNLLQARQKQQDFKGQAVPDAEDGQRDNHQPRLRQPFLRPDAQQLQEIVDIPVVCVEQPEEGHANGDGGGDVGQEVDGLKKPPHLRNTVDQQRRAKGQRQGDGQSHQQQDGGVLAGQPEGGILQHPAEGGQAEARAGIGDIDVFLIEGGAQHHDQGIQRERQKQQNHAEEDGPHAPGDEPDEFLPEGRERLCSFKRRVSEWYPHGKLS